MKAVNSLLCNNVKVVNSLFWSFVLVLSVQLRDVINSLNLLPLSIPLCKTNPAMTSVLFPCFVF